MKAKKLAPSFSLRVAIRQEADRTAFRVDARMDLRGEAASASAHKTISTLFFGPEHADAPARSSCRSSAPCRRGP